MVSSYKTNGKLNRGVISDCVKNAEVFKKIFLVFNNYFVSSFSSQQSLDTLN